MYYLQKRMAIPWSLFFLLSLVLIFLKTLITPPNLYAFLESIDLTSLHALGVKLSLERGPDYYYKRFNFFIFATFFFSSVGLIHWFNSVWSKRFLLLTFSSAAGFILIRFIAPHIFFPYSNPLEVVGPLTKLHFSPHTNLLRFLLFVLAPTLVSLSIFTLFPASKKFFLPSIEKRKSYEFSIPLLNKVLFSLSLIMVIFWGLLDFSVFTQATYAPSFFDIFHEGELLTPAVNFLKGHGIWKGSYSIHGALHDIFLTVISWKIFGVENIAASRVATYFSFSIVPLAVAFLIFATSLISIDEKNFFAKVFIGQVMLYLHFQFNYKMYYFDRRDFYPLIGMGLTLLFLHTERKFYLFFAGLMSVVTYFNTIDRGAYYLAYFLVFNLLIYLFSPQTKKDKFQTIKIAFLSLFVGYGLLISIVGVDEFFNFVDNTKMFYQTKDLFDSYIFPFGSKSFVHLVPIAILGTSLMYSTWFIFQQRKKKENWKGIVLLLSYVALATFYFRSALGRSDEGHVHYSCGLSYLCLGVSLSIFLIFEGNRTLNRLLLIFIMISNGYMLKQGFSVFNFQLAREFPQRLKQFVHTPDINFYGPAFNAELEEMKKLFKDEKCIYSLTSEAALGYLLQKNTCGKNYVAWFDSPRPKREELKLDLIKYRPEYIFYETKGSGWSQIDGINNEERFSDVLSFVKKHYKEYPTPSKLWVIYKLLP